MNAVIYARYSSENQNDQSIEQQIRECKDFADANCITVIDSYSDRAMTGRNDNRVAFQKMIRDSAKRQFEAVIVWKLDRFGRNREEIAINKSKLRHNGVKVLYAKECIPETPEGIILESVLEGIAEYYSASLSQNIMRGMRENALNCLSTGPGLSLGYYLKDKQFHIDEHAANIVKGIYTDYANGDEITEIYKALNEKGYKTIRGKPFNCNSIIRILDNRRYIGEYKWHDVFNPSGMPRIIEDELWERAQTRRKKSKKTPVQSRGVDYLLTSKLFCGLCGKPMIGDSGIAKGSKYTYYTCQTRKRNHGCDKKSVNKEYIERLVVETTINKVLTDDYIEQVATAAVELQERETENTELNYYKSKLKETEKILSNLLKAIEQGIINETTQSRMLELEQEKRELMAGIARESISRPKISKQFIVDTLKQFKAAADIDNPKDRQRIIDCFVGSVWLYDDKTVITYNIGGDDTTVSLETVSDKSAMVEMAVIETASENSSSQLSTSVARYLGFPSKHAGGQAGSYGSLAVHDGLRGSPPCTFTANRRSCPGRGAPGRNGCLIN